ncbi:MAG: aminotransferase class I/II-fold pyridoxal phosphate-dependent enzyme, partial [Bacteroidetes bacterium]|nr:aminotransferase class I/II-fold pyridoxal phosphate-dependent enzyme [Bacteroidota bacterium]MBU1580492.1 aminotransferase class I/II-fold pyridoxal phosphate-dependent enzyme [Bacteroidota bacterium]
SFESIKDQVILINGLSKGFAMTGWRVGYLAAHQEIVNACINIQGQYTSGSCTISQAAALEAVKTIPTESAELNTMNSTFKTRRDLLFNRLNTIEGIIPNKPKGAFYMFPDISYYFGKTAGDFRIANSRDLSLYLLEKAHVALVSGDAFGCDNCIRFSYATTESLLEEACNRIEKALKLLK